MNRTKSLAFLAATMFSASTFAQTGPAPPPAAPPAALEPAPPAPSYSVADTDIGTLLDNPGTKAILDKHLPGFSENPQIDMARGVSLKMIQAYAADTLTDEVLAKIDTDLAKIVAKP